MGLFDLWGRKRSESRGAASDPVVPAPAMSADEQAIARYRYLLRTAPPEAMEQAHAEAFAQLTPDQRSKVLQSMSEVVPAAEREAMLRQGASASSLARAATRAELRQPGAMERTFRGMGGGAPGLGGLMAGTMLSTMAGMVLGSVVAQHFIAQQGDDAHAGGDDAAAGGGEPGHWSDAGAADDGGSGGFDDGSFDV